MDTITTWDVATDSDHRFRLVLKREGVANRASSCVYLAEIIFVGIELQGALLSHQ
jgi:hypothetical protein